MKISTSSPEELELEAYNKLANIKEYLNRNNLILKH